MKPYYLCEEHIDWEVMGPIYAAQCKALHLLVLKLKQALLKLRKEN